MFGQPVVWNVQGAELFKTNFGTLLTILMVTMMLSYGVRKFVMMYRMDNPVIRQYPLQINLSDNKSLYHYGPSSSHFNLAFGFADGRKLPSSIGSFEVSYTIRTA